MNTITITEIEAKRYKFPAKAIGYWAIIEETEEYKLLHRLTKDGRLGSNRPNNILKIKKLNVDDFFTEKKPNDEKLLTAKTSNGQTVVVARMHTENISEAQVGKPTEETVKMDEPQPKWQSMNIGTRKTRWIEQLLGKMKTEPFTAQFLEKAGENKFVEQVLKDTDAKRNGGKAYSSIDSAMRVWNGRISRGEF